MSKSNTIVYKTLSNTNTNTPKKISTISDLKLSFNKQLIEKDLKIEMTKGKIVISERELLCKLCGDGIQLAEIPLCKSCISKIKSIED